MIALFLIAVVENLLGDLTETLGKARRGGGAPKDLKNITFQIIIFYYYW